MLTPAAEGMPGAVRKAEELAAENTNYFMPQQFKNPANPEIHRQTTAEEIWRDTGREGRHLVVCRRGHRRHDHRRRRGAQAAQARRPHGRRRAGRQPGDQRSAWPASRFKPGKHTIQGIGAGFIPDVLNLDVIDEVVQVGDEDAMETARQLARLEGFMCGISCGAAAWAALQLARRPENAGKLIVVDPARPRRAVSVDEAVPGVEEERRVKREGEWRPHFLSLEH